MAFFLKFYYPIAYPLIWLLDTLVPPEDPEEEAYNRGELSALVQLYGLGAIGWKGALSTAT